MLVKVSKKYCGTLGLYNPDTNSVIQKDNTSAPFEIDDALALFHIRNGIIVKADAIEDGAAQATLPEMPEEILPEEEPAEDIPVDAPEEVPEGIPDENPIDEDDLDSIEDYKTLKSMAKKAGINPFGKNKEELRAAIRDSRA